MPEPDLDHLFSAENLMTADGNRAATAWLTRQLASGELRRDAVTAYVAALRGCRDFRTERQEADAERKHNELLAELRKVQRIAKGHETTSPTSWEPGALTLPREPS